MGLNGGRTPDTRGYVASIAGLRSIAVLSIVAYHVNAAWMPGGFTGVDIFFVISGFVVAHSVIGRPHETFRGYLAWFYKRRFQRILPAAFLYIAVAALVSLAFIPLAPQTKFLEVTGAASVVALSNFALWLKAGDYFAASSELNLFTHTWSLAVEEQYYLFFPFFSFPLLVSAGAGTRMRKAALAFIIMACIGSLAAAAWLSTRAPTFAFYMLPTRFWELGIGFLLRLWLSGAGAEKFADRTRPYAPLIAWIALAGLAVALVVTDPTRFPFPGAVLPCFATLLLIAVIWCHPGVWVDRLLSLPVPVWFGNVSYSLYLWHWGVIVLMRWTIGIDTLPLQLTALAAMLVLTYLSYTYVEQAFHNRAQRGRPPSARLFLGYGAAAAVVVAICFGSFLAKPAIGLPAADRVAVWDPYARPPLPADCPTERRKGGLGAGEIMTFAASCTHSDARNLYIVGDSHAGAYQRAAWRIAGTGRYHVTLLTLGGCRPILLSELPKIAGCPEFLAAARTVIARTARAGDVIFLAGLQTTRYRTPLGVPLDARPSDPVTIAASRVRLAAFTSLGATVIVEGAKPVALVELYRCSDWFNRNNPDCRPTKVASPSETLRRVDIASRGIADTVAGNGAVTIWEPKSLLCTDRDCPAFIDGHPLYFDEDHLTAFANDRLLPSLLRAIDTASRRSAKG